MRRSALGGFAFLIAIVSFCASSSSPAQTKKDPGTYVGKRWSWELIQKKDVVEEGTFRVDNFEIFKGGIKIGTYKLEGKDLIKVTFTHGKLKGAVAELRLAKQDPMTWRGETKKDGEHFRTKIVFLKD